MSEEPETQDEETPKKKSKLGLLLGFVFLILGAGGGFMAVQMGFFGGGSSDDAQHEDDASALDPLPDVAFVPLDPLIISLGAHATARHLRFSAQLEVEPSHLSEVESIKPRIVDVLNSYLRAVETSDLEDPTALLRLRSQMLRRIQVVSGQGRVRDLLIMEFVLN